MKKNLVIWLAVLGAMIMISQPVSAKEDVSVVVPKKLISNDAVSLSLPITITNHSDSVIYFKPFQCDTPFVHYVQEKGKWRKTPDASPYALCTGLGPSDGGPTPQPLAAGATIIWEGTADGSGIQRIGFVYSFNQDDIYHDATHATEVFSNVFTVNKVVANFTNIKKACAGKRFKDQCLVVAAKNIAVSRLADATRLCQDFKKTSKSLSDNCFQGAALLRARSDVKNKKGTGVALKLCANSATASGRSVCEKMVASEKKNQDDNEKIRVMRQDKLQSLSSPSANPSPITNPAPANPVSSPASVLSGQMRWQVINAETKRGVPGVPVVFSHSSQMTYADEDGFVSLPAQGEFYIPKHGAYFASQGITPANYPDAKILLYTESIGNAKINYLLGTSASSADQSTLIVGSVVSKDGHVVANQAVSVYQSSASAITDASGHFSLPLPGESSSYRLYFPGTATTDYFQVDVYKGHQTNVVIAL